MEAERTFSALDAQDLQTIKGWFNPSDRHLFQFLLGSQVEQGCSGALVELGCFLGKSAVVIGQFVQPDEEFTVLDLFEGEAGDVDNTKELLASYSALTRDAFEANYQRFHRELPSIVQATSDQIRDHVPHGSARFVHVDASHLYEHVSTDVDSARLLLQPGGIVAFDDYRTEHTPGVSAAVWEAVFAKDLRVIAVTESKLYGTWGDPAPWQHSIASWLAGRENTFCETQLIAEQPVLRVKVWDPPVPSAPKPPPVVPKPTPAPREVTPQPVAPPARTGLRKVAKEWLPPAVHRAIQRRVAPPK